VSSIAAAVVTRLEAVSAVTNLVGDRIYQGTLPQEPVLPAVRVQRIGEVITLHLRGSSGMFKERLQVDSVSDSAEPIGDAQAIDSAVFGDGSGSSLVGFQGEIDSFHIYCVEPAGAREQYDGEELRQYRVMRDVFVTWTSLAGSP
jgi:hypothetical protein